MPRRHGSGGLLQVVTGFTHGWLLYLPLVLSALLFGLPHGAIDHLVALGLAGKSLTLPALLCICGLYLLLAMLYAALWWLAPGFALLGYLLMTLYHWGKADTVFELILRPDGALAGNRLLLWTHTAVRGLLPIGLPLAAFPEASAAFLQSCLAFFMDPSTPIEIPGGLIALSLCALLLLEGGLLLRSPKPEGRIALLLETISLIALFTLVPPLAAIGWYFCLWHGLRHVLRLCRYSAEEKPSAKPMESMRLFFYRALPFTLLSLMFLGLAGVLLPTGGDPARWVALYLVLIAALTFPHIVLVEWMDRREMRE